MSFFPYLQRAKCGLLLPFSEHLFRAKIARLFFTIRKLGSRRVGL